LDVNFVLLSSSFLLPSKLHGCKLNHPLVCHLIHYVDVNLSSSLILPSQLHGCKIDHPSLCHLIIWMQIFPSSLIMPSQLHGCKIDHLLLCPPNYMDVKLSIFYCALAITWM
jgi:hypothetical protein